jgi:hypothetical protein
MISAEPISPSYDPRQAGLSADKTQSWELTRQVIKALGWIAQKAVIYDRATCRISRGRRRIRT